MNKQALKTDLLKWVESLNDTNTLNELKQLKESHDWWNHISEAEKIGIEEGINQLDNGETIPHELVMKEAQDKYGS